MELPEPTREDFLLPKHVLDLYQQAYDAELSWHILDVFGYETGVLSDSEFRELYAMFCHEDANSEHNLSRVSACNAFVRFVNKHGGHKEFAMKESELLEWRPCDAPFNWVDIEGDETR